MRHASQLQRGGATAPRGSKPAAAGSQPPMQRVPTHSVTCRAARRPAALLAAAAHKARHQLPLASNGRTGRCQPGRWVAARGLLGDDDDDDLADDDVAVVGGEEDEEESEQDEDDDVELDAIGDDDELEGVLGDSEEIAEAFRRQRKGRVLLDDEGEAAGDDDDDEAVMAAGEDDEEDDADAAGGATPTAPARRAKDDPLAYLEKYEAFDDRDDEEEAPEEDDGAGYEPPPFLERPARTYRLQELLLKGGYEERAQVVAEATCSGLQDDPQRVAPGDLFFAAGGTPEGRKQAAAMAVERGASAVVSCDHIAGLPPEVPCAVVDDVELAAQRIAAAFYDEPSRQLTTVGVAGGHGKSSTCWLIRGILEESQRLTGLVDSIECALAEERLDADGELWQPSEDDPTASRDCSAPNHLAPYQGKYPLPDGPPSGLRYQKLLGGIAERGAHAVVVEVKQQALEAGSVSSVDFDVLVVTDTGKEAAEAAGMSRERLVQLLEERLATLTDPERQRAVINLDDPAAARLRAAASLVHEVTYSLTRKEADVRAEKVKYSVWETEILVATPYGRLQIITPLLGRHNVYNVLAAVAAGISINTELKQIVAGIEAVEVIPGRCEVVDEGQPFPVVVDAACNPDTLGRLLDDIREAGARQIWLVMGCQGGRDEAQRPYMGEVAHYKADWVFVTDDNPRNEDGADIVADVVSGFPEELHRWRSVYPYLQDPTLVPEDYHVFLWSYQSAIRKYIVQDRFSAIRCAIGMASARDVVVVTGKGHTDFQEYGDGKGNIRRGWFDDRVECRNALSKLGYLYAIRDLDRREIPWSRYPEERQDYPLRTGYVPASFLRKAKAAKATGEPSTPSNAPPAVDQTTARRAARAEETQREREQQQQEASQEQQQAGAGL